MSTRISENRVSNNKNLSGQLTIIHQPIFPWNKEVSLPKRYLLGAQVVWGHYNLTRNMDPMGSKEPRILLTAHFQHLFRLNQGVSKNRGTPKSSILMKFSIINHPFWGTPIFGNIRQQNVISWKKPSAPSEGLENFISAKSCAINLGTRVSSGPVLGGSCPMTCKVVTWMSQEVSKWIVSGL